MIKAILKSLNKNRLVIRMGDLSENELLMFKRNVLSSKRKQECGGDSQPYYFTVWKSNELICGVKLCSKDINSRELSLRCSEFAVNTKTEIDDLIPALRKLGKTLVKLCKTESKVAILFSGIRMEQLGLTFNELSMSSGWKVYSTKVFTIDNDRKPIEYLTLGRYGFKPSPCTQSQLIAS